MTQRPHLRSSDVWRELLPDAVAVIGSAPWSAPAALDHFGDPDGERVALLQGEPVMVPRLAAGHLRLTGGDRVGFVQGLMSQDIATPTLGFAVDSLLLDHRGQPQAGLMVLRRENDIYLAVEDGASDTVAQKFEAQIIFDDVQLQRLDEQLIQLTLIGAEVTLKRHLVELWSALAEPLEAALAHLAQGGLKAAIPVAGAPSGVGRSLVFARRFGPHLSLDLHLLAADLQSAYPHLLRLGFRPVGERALTAGRVAYTIASPFAEGGLGLPQESGLEGRVSYRKGCYLGQEIMARVEARGNLRRSLQPIRLEGAPPGLGVAQAWKLLDGEGRAIGDLRSLAPAADGEGWWGLAVVRRDAADAAVAAADRWPWLLQVSEGSERLRMPAPAIRAGLRTAPVSC